jgi:hypothetical protein
MSGSYTTGTEGRRLWPSSLQRQKRLGNQVDHTKTNPRAGPYQSLLYPGSHTPGTLRSWANNLEISIASRHSHLTPYKIRHNHWLSRASDNMHSRAGIHHITAWHNDSTMRTRINIVITLTPDKLAWWGLGSSQEIQSTENPDAQYQSRSPFPGALHPSEKWSKATPASTVWRGRMTPVSRHCSHVY